MRAIAREMITGRRAAGLASQIARDSFITGLRNAHAMEIQARDLAKRQSERLYRTAGDGIPPAASTLARPRCRPNGWKIALQPQGRGRRR